MLPSLLPRNNATSLRGEGMEEVLTPHGVRLARPSLSVRQHRHIVAVQTAPHKGANTFSIDSILFHIYKMIIATVWLSNHALAQFSV